jgi:hypothetical protein
MNKVWWIMSVIVVAIGCNDAERELQRSVYIQDPDAPGLPLYTEWGYNTFGAYYDRTAWNSNYVNTPAKVTFVDGVTTLMLDGDLAEDGYYSRSMELRITLPDITPATFSDLVQLHNTAFDLTDPAMQVTLVLDGQAFTPQVLEGSFEFVRAQSLLVDDAPIEVILSGRFDLKFANGVEPVTISDGRFDVGIGQNNFYAY